jgi:hypothetical protein
MFIPDIGSRILIFTHPGFRIQGSKAQDPGSRIRNRNTGILYHSPPSKPQIFCLFYSITPRRSGSLWKEKDSCSFSGNYNKI